MQEDISPTEQHTPPTVVAAPITQLEEIECAGVKEKMKVEKSKEKKRENEDSREKEEPVNRSHWVQNEGKRGSTSPPSLGAEAESELDVHKLSNEQVKVIRT